jgi:hypothetical protein
MAHVDKDKKLKIAAAIKQVMPQGWKYSLAVHHHSMIVLTVAAAPFDVMHAIGSSEYFNADTATHAEVNEYHLRAHINDECLADVCEKLVEALNTENFDNSDSQTDYFHVGHYIKLQFGRWDRPFKVLPAQAALLA